MAKKKENNWLSKYENGGYLGYTTEGRNYSPSWGGAFEEGGDLVRIGAPSNGKYAKKTLPSAEYGMTYFQNGLDFQPKTISKKGNTIKKKPDVAGISPIFKYPEATYEENRASMLFPFPTPNDLQLGNTRQLSDSAQFVSGFRSPKPIEEIWPDEFNVNSPFEGGYVSKIAKEKRLKELPGKINFMTGKIKQKEHGGELKKLDQLTNWTNYNWLNK